MSSRLKRLDISAPAIFEQTIGYHGESEWLAIHLEPQIEQIVCSDGNSVIINNSDFWEIMLDCLISNSHLHLETFSEKYCFLLNRKTRIMYTGEQAVIERYLQHADCLNLFAAFQSDVDTGSQCTSTELQKSVNPHQSRLKTNSLIAQVIKGLTVAGVAAAFLMVAVNRLPKNLQPVRMVSQHEATILQAAFNPNPQTLIDAATASVDPSLPSVEAIILTQNRLTASAQLEWHLIMKLFQLGYEACLFLLVVRSGVLVIKKSESVSINFQIILLLPTGLVFVNLLSAMALASVTSATVLFLDLAVALVTWSLANSVENIAVDLINTLGVLRSGHKDLPAE
jgi:hypothetical protein